MAKSLTNYGEVHVLDAVFGGQSLPATWYLALFTADPTETGSLAAEAANYTRLAVTNNLTNFPAAVSGAPSTKNNGTQLLFAAASGATGTITHVGFMDSVTLGAGNMWAWYDLGTSKSYAFGDIPVLQINDILITLD